jgi:hypothetical protein
LGEEIFLFIKLQCLGTFTVCVACPCEDADEFSLSSDKQFLIGQHFCKQNCLLRIFYWKFFLNPNLSNFDKTLPKDIKLQGLQLQQSSMKTKIKIPSALSDKKLEVQIFTPG